MEGGRRRTHEDGVRGKPGSGGNAGGKVGGLVAVQATIGRNQVSCPVGVDIGCFSIQRHGPVGVYHPLTVFRHHDSVCHHDCVSLVAP